jgi:hypothetical protein
VEQVELSDSVFLLDEDKSSFARLLLWACESPDNRMQVKLMSCFYADLDTEYIYA